jgi:hypothetical protein
MKPLQTKKPTGKRVRIMTITIRKSPEFTDLLQENLNRRYEERRRLGDSSIHVSDILPTNCIRKQYYSRKFPEMVDFKPFSDSGSQE